MENACDKKWASDDKICRFLVVMINVSVTDVERTEGKSCISPEALILYPYIGNSEEEPDFGEA